MSGGSVSANQPTPPTLREQIAATILVANQSLWEDKSVEHWTEEAEAEHAADAVMELLKGLPVSDAFAVWEAAISKVNYVRVPMPEGEL